MKMIVFTAKLTRRKLVSGILAMCILICSVVVLVRNSSRDEDVLVAGNTQSVQTNAKIRTNDERVAFIESYGWSIDKEPIEFMEVKIPEKFDGVYDEYNSIQKQQGLDLTKYSGKRVMRYTYKVNNHPSNEEGVVVNIIVWKNRIIAADVSSPKLGGFMHGIAQSSQTMDEGAGLAEDTVKTTEKQGTN